MVDRSDVERQSIFSILFTISVPRVHKGRKKQRSIDILLATSIVMNDENVIFGRYGHDYRITKHCFIILIELIRDYILQGEHELIQYNTNVFPLI